MGIRAVRRRKLLNRDSESPSVECILDASRLSERVPIDNLGPVYTGPDKFGTGPLRDLIGSAPKRSHESGPKLFQIARPFTWDRIVRQIAKIIAVFVETHLVVEDESLPKSQNIEE